VLDVFSALVAVPSLILLDIAKRAFTTTTRQMDWISFNALLDGLVYFNALSSRTFLADESLIYLPRAFGTQILFSALHTEKTLSTLDWTTTQGTVRSVDFLYDLLLGRI
jgi:hypothetical protein